eukprot:2147942-Rhodomonas_salina.3
MSGTDIASGALPEAKTALGATRAWYGRIVFTSNTKAWRAMSDSDTQKFPQINLLQHPGGKTSEVPRSYLAPAFLLPDSLHVLIGAEARQLARVHRRPGCLGARQAVREALGGAH